MTAPLRVAVINQFAGGGATVAARALEAGAEQHGWELRWFPTEDTRDPGALEAALEAFDPAVLHLHCWYETYPIEALARWTERWPVVFTVHDVFVVNQFGDECWECYRSPTCLGCPALPFAKRWRPNVRVRARWRKGRAFRFRKPPHLIYPSEWMRRRLSRSEWRHCSGTMIPYAIDPQPWSRPREEAAVPTVLFAGNMYSDRDHRKGLPDLLEGWRAVREALPDAELRIAGQILTSASLPEGVTVLGSCDTATLATELARASAFCLPSRGDNSPLAVLEAMAAGTPVVATRVGGVPEQLGDSGGVLVAPRMPADLAHGLIEVLLDPTDARRRAAIARERLEARHAPSVVLSAHDRLYRLVAEST